MIDTRELIARTNLPSLIGETVRLKKITGKRWLGSCPVHNEKTASFYVFEDDPHFHCYGCGAHGDAFDWLKERAGLEFKDAATELARRAGLDLSRPQEPRIQAPRKPRFPQPDPRPVTPWGGQHLMAGNRPVYVLNDFPGRARYLDLAERNPGVALVWYPRPHTLPAEMYLEPIARATVTPEPFPGLWEAYRAAALLDAIAGFRLRAGAPARASLAAHVHDHLLIEAMRVEGWIEFFLSRNNAGEGGESAQRVAAPSTNETGHAAAA